MFVWLTAGTVVAALVWGYVASTLTEALFWFSGYGEDGYILFFDDFRKSARFTWGYP